MILVLISISIIALLLVFRDRFKCCRPDNKIKKEEAPKEQEIEKEEVPSGQAATHLPVCEEEIVVPDPILVLKPDSPLSSEKDLEEEKPAAK